MHGKTLLLLRQVLLRLRLLPLLLLLPPLPLRLLLRLRLLLLLHGGHHMAAITWQPSHGGQCHRCAPRRHPAPRGLDLVGRTRRAGWPGLFVGTKRDGYICTERWQRDEICIQRERETE